MQKLIKLKLKMVERNDSKPSQNPNSNNTYYQEMFSKYRMKLKNQMNNNHSNNSNVNSNQLSQLAYGSNGYGGQGQNNQGQLNTSIPFNSNNYNLNNNSMSYSNSNIFETAFDRNKRKKQTELILEGKNNQKIIYESEKNERIEEEVSVENKDLNRLYQSIDSKLNNFKNNFNSNNIGMKNKLLGSSLSINNMKNNFNNDLNHSMQYNPQKLISVSNQALNKYSYNSNKNSDYVHNLNNQSINMKQLVKYNEESHTSTSNVTPNPNSNLLVHDLEGKKYKMNFFKFMALKDINKLHIINYMEPTDYFSFALTCKQFYSILVNHLLKVAKEISDAFNEQYKRLLHSVKPVVIFQKIKDFKGKKFYANLVIKAEIFSIKLLNKTVSIGFLSKFFTDKTGHSNVFRFDVMDNKKPLTFWLMREYTYVSLFKFFV